MWVTFYASSAVILPHFPGGAETPALDTECSAACPLPSRQSLRTPGPIGLRGPGLYERAPSQPAMPPSRYVSHSRLPAGDLIPSVVPPISSHTHIRECFQKAVITLAPHYEHPDPLSSGHHPQGPTAHFLTQKPVTRFLRPPPGMLCSIPSQFPTTRCLNGAISCVLSFTRHVLSAGMTSISVPRESPRIFPDPTRTGSLSLRSVPWFQNPSVNAFAALLIPACGHRPPSPRSSARGALVLAPSAPALPAQGRFFQVEHSSPRRMPHLR